MDNNGLDLNPINEADLNKCIICQRKSGNLTSELNGRKKIIEASKKVKDDILNSVSSLDTLKYHMKCYRSYTRKGDRVSVGQEPEDNNDLCESLDTLPTSSKRPKR